MYLILIAWLYVALMMAVAEASSPIGSILGAITTFVLYGAAPVALLMYILGTPGRKRAIKAREAREREEWEAKQKAGSGQPDAGAEAPADAVPPVRKEP